MEGLDLGDEAQLDAMFEATGGNATAVERDGVVLLPFERPVGPGRGALLTAVRDVESLGAGVRVIGMAG